MTELHTGDRGWLSYDPGWSYRLGPLDAPDLVVLGVDDQGVEWWCDEPEGWAAPTAATVVDERPQGDGGYDGDTTYGPRPLTLGGGSAPGLAVAPDRRTALAAARRLTRTALSRGPVLLTGPAADDDGTVGDWSTWVRASGQPKLSWVSDHAFEWSFVVVAPDPFLFDAREQAQPHEAALPVPPVGAQWPILWPAAWGGGGTDTSLLLTNRGDEPAQARYVITNPPPDPADPDPGADAVDHPTIVNDRSGLYFTINRVLNPGDTVEVDTRTATVKINGVGIFLDLVGSFPLVEPGANTVRWSHRGLHNPRARLTVTTASTRK